MPVPTIQNAVTRLSSCVGIRMTAAPTPPTIPIHRTCKPVRTVETISVIMPATSAIAASGVMKPRASYAALWVSACSTACVVKSWPVTKL